MSDKKLFSPTQESLDSYEEKMAKWEQDQQDAAELALYKQKEARVRAVMLAVAEHVRMNASSVKREGNVRSYDGAWKPVQPPTDHFVNLQAQLRLIQTASKQTLGIPHAYKPASIVLDMRPYHSTREVNGNSYQPLMFEIQEDGAHLLVTEDKDLPAPNSWVDVEPDTDTWHTAIRVLEQYGVQLP